MLNSLRFHPHTIAFPLLIIARATRRSFCAKVIPPSLLTFLLTFFVLCWAPASSSHETGFIVSKTAITFRKCLFFFTHSYLTDVMMSVRGGGGRGEWDSTRRKSTVRIWNFETISAELVKMWKRYTILTVQSFITRQSWNRTWSVREWS